MMKWVSLLKHTLDALRIRGVHGKVFEKFHIDGHDYRALIENIPAVFYHSSLDPHPAILYISPQVQDMLGFTPEECVSTPGLWERQIHPEDRERVLDEYSQFIVHKRVFDMEYRLFALDGTLLWVRDKAIKVQGNHGSLHAQGFLLDTTDRRRAEQERQKWADVVRSIKVGVGVGTPDGKIEMVNLFLANMYGYTVEELIGKSVSVLLSPESHKGFFERLRRAHEEGFATFEGTGIKKNGAKFPVQADITAVKDDRGNMLYQIVSSQDITARRNAEEVRDTLIDELQAALDRVLHAKAEWQNTFDSITDMIVILDAELRVVRANKAFFEYFALTYEDAINIRYQEVPRASDFIAECQAMRSLPGQTRKEVLDSRKNRVLMVQLYPFYSSEGKVEGSICIMKDITDEKEKEMRLLSSERLASLGQVASGIAHEINNPLATIRVCAEGLSERITHNRFNPEFFQEYLRLIDEEVVRCKGIINNMLSFIREEKYKTREVNLNEVVTNTLALIGFQGRLLNVQLKQELLEDLPQVRAVEGELKQVLIIVISNALDAMGDKGTLSIATGIEDANVYIRIRDIGPGIPAEVLSKMFNPFFTTKAAGGGTGLGLWIAKNIIANHNGSIEVQTEAGKGSTFTIKLPLH